MKNCKIEYVVLLCIVLIFIVENVVLLLMLHILPMPRFYIVADRYLYLACVGSFF